MKELDKWFEQNREVGAIDDYFRENSSRSWDNFNLKTKIAFYEEFSGNKYIEPKKKPDNKVESSFPAIKRVLTRRSIQSLEGNEEELLSERYEVIVETANPEEASKQFLEAFIGYGLFAPLPYSLRTDNHEVNLEELLGDIYPLFHIISDYFSRMGFNTRDKQDERAAFFGRILPYINPSIDFIKIRALVRGELEEHYIKTGRPLAAQYLTI